MVSSKLPKVFIVAILPLILVGCICNNSIPSSDSKSKSSADSIPTFTVGTITPTGEIYKPTRKSVPCSIVSQSELTTDFPDDMPIYTNSTQFKAECKDGQYSIRFRTYDDLTKVTDYIKSNLTLKGWKVTSDQDRTTEYTTYKYYHLINAEKAGGQYGTRYAIYDIRNDTTASDGSGEIIIRENY